MTFIHIKKLTILLGNIIYVFVVFFKNGESALHIACRENLLPVVQLMCALGCRVDIKNKKEMTPLHSMLRYIKFLNSKINMKKYRI